MTSVTDRSIDALRATHDDLAAVVGGMSDQQLTTRSGASEWSVAQVLSHMGSGAEISLATLRAALVAAPRPGNDFNEDVWARWNAMGPGEQATGFLAGDEELVSALEALSVHERQSLHVDLGFLPSPMPLAGYAGMRLNEAVLHSWDVRVSVDPDATIGADTAALVAEHLATDLSFMLGFTGKAAELAHPAVVDIDGSGFAVIVGDGVSLSTSATPATATFTGQLEAAIRLLAGRLTTQYTPEDVEVTGNVSLDDLRRVFPGY
jgi:uncharacterized protein (TIGR03083 family)